MYETSNNIYGDYAWYNDASNAANSDSPWFNRGGLFGHNVLAGAFASFDYSGEPYGVIGFRPVLAREHRALVL